MLTNRHQNIRRVNHVAHAFNCGHSQLASDLTHIDAAPVFERRVGIDKPILRPAVSPAFQIGERSPAGLDQLVWLDPEHVVPGSRRRPHLVVLQQIRIDEDARLLLKPKRGHATSGFVNPSH